MSNLPPFDFNQFFNLKQFTDIITSHGGLTGFVVFILNIFVTVLSVVGQIVKGILGLLGAK